MNIQEIKGSVISRPSFKVFDEAEKTKPMYADNKELVNSKGSVAFKSYVLGGMSAPSFTGFPCSTGEFNRHMDYVTCACCGKKMINGSQTAINMADEFRASRGEERIKIMDRNMEVFRPVEKVLIKGMKKFALKKPEATTDQLVSLVAKNKTEVLKSGQLDVLNAVDEEAKKIYGEDNKISKFVNSQRPFITGAEHNDKFKREVFIKRIDALTTKECDFDSKGKILNKAIDMPFESDFFKKVNKDYTDPKKFIRGLFSNAIKTAEHIHPKSLGGPNNTENYMSECNECNENRQNYNLNNYWQTRYPSMPYNVQKYADTVTEQIIDGTINGKFVDYPVDLKAAVESETEGVIKVKVMNPEEINKKREEKGLPALRVPERKSATTEEAKQEDKKETKAA